MKKKLSKAEKIGPWEPGCYVTEDLDCNVTSRLQPRDCSRRQHAYWSKHELVKPEKE